MNSTDSKLEQALFYIALEGLSLVPLWGVKDGVCECPKGKNCTSPGKHPHGGLAPHGRNSATRDINVVKRWFAVYPNLNLACATGPESGCAVLDIDPRNGGNESLAKLTEKYGPLPDTAVVNTGGGGLHIYFECPDAPLKSREIAPGLELKAEGGMVNLPPSTHKSGRSYEWQRPLNGTPFAPVPDWLLSLASTRKQTATNGVELSSKSGFREGERNNGLTSLAGALRNHGFTASALETVLNGVNRTACQPPLQESEVKSIAKSVGRYPAAKVSKPIMNDAAFRGLLGDAVAAIDPHTEADPVAVLVELMCGFGNLIGRNRYFSVGASKHHLNLFAVLTGDTSVGRKGTARAEAKRVLVGIDPDWDRRREQGLSSGEGLIWAVRDPITRTKPIRRNRRIAEYEEEIEDHGVSDKRLLIHEDEFASVLKVISREGNTLSPVVRPAWDGETLASLTKNSRAKATAPHISIVGHVTKDELLRYLKQTETANGFANRFLWFCVSRSKCLAFSGQVPGQTIDDLRERFRSAYLQTSSPVELTWGDDARDLWAERYEQISSPPPGMLGAITSRGAPQVIRIACIYATLEGRNVVGRSHLESALAVWEYSYQSAVVLFGNAVGDSDTEKLLRFIRKSAERGVTRTQIRDLFHRNKSMVEIQRILDDLKQQELISKVTKQSSNSRPTEIWRAR